MEPRSCPLLASGMRAAIAATAGIGQQRRQCQIPIGPLPSADPAVRAQFPAAYVSSARRPGWKNGWRRHACGSCRTRKPSYVTTYDPTAPYARPKRQPSHRPTLISPTRRSQQVTARYDFAMTAQAVRIYSQMMKVAAGYQDLEARALSACAHTRDRRQQFRARYVVIRWMRASSPPLSRRYHSGRGKRFEHGP
jgi:hypothetical protein